MPIFSYSARDRNGQQYNESIDSPSREAAIASLRAQGLLPLKITALKAGGVDAGTFSLNPYDYQALNDKDIEHEFHQIAVMLRSGISLLDALQLVSRQSRIGARKTWQQLARRIQQGASFYEALLEHRNFTEFTVQLVRVGEQTGYLGVVMDQAAMELKKSRKLKKTITTALRYPLFCLLMAIGTVVLMLTKLVPEIKKVLEITGKPMPPITRALIDTSDWFLGHGLLIAALVACFLMLSALLYVMPASRWWIDFWALRIPVLGLVFRLSGTVLFTRAMSLLLRSGVVIIDALETIEKLHTNTYLASQVALTRERVLQGASLADTMQANYGYMPLMLQMLRVGENTGRLDSILDEMTEYFDEMLQQRVTLLTGLITPILTVFVGGTIGFVYAAFLVAMFAASGGSPS